jgi:signal transduction histidine kinase
MEGNRLLAVGTIVGIGVALALVAVVVAFRTSRRLTTPIEELAAHAERLGTGDLRPTETTYGIAELDRLADSMDVSVQRIAALLAEERRLTLDASHQLKTPLTALSLRLEELAAWPDDKEVRAEARAALEQVERLSAVVDDLLRDRRAPYASRAQVPLGAVVDQQLSEWRPAFTAARRVLASQGSVPPSALVEPGPVGQVLAALIENSLVHGRGRTTVDVSTSNGAPWVEVSDEGPGVPDEIVARVFERDVSGAGGTGLGLAAAQDAAVSVGGRLALVRRRPAHFRFFLDGGKHPTPVGPEAEQGAEADADHVGGDVVSKG